MNLIDWLIRAFEGALAMYTDPETTPPASSQAWQIFITPGRLILYWRYLFPKPGNAFGSARQVDDPVAQVLFAAGFWGLVAIFVIGLIFGR